MRFDKFDECAIGVFNIGEVPGSFSHIKCATVNREGKSLFAASLTQCLHADHVKAQMNKAHIAPEPVFKNFPRRTAFCLHEFNCVTAQQWRKRSAAWCGMSEQYPA